MAKAHSAIFALPTAAAIVLAPTSTVQAGQAYPSETIRLMVPSAAGTPPDISCRIIANALGEAEGWRIVVENRAGAAQSAGAAEALRHSADGHTPVCVAMSISVAPALLAHIPFRLETDFAPVAKIATAYHVLVVNPSVPAASLPELVALLKREPDKLTFSSGGYGTPAHLAGELFKITTGVRATHVVYPALPRAITDLLNGTNQFQFITPMPVLGLIETGKLRALAVTAPTRLPWLPNVPTVVESGLPDLIVQDWIGLLVKTGTPEDVVARLNVAVNRALAKPEVRQALAKLGAEAAGGTPAEFGAFLHTQIGYWANIVKEAGIRLQQ